MGNKSSSQSNSPENSEMDVNDPNLINTSKTYLPKKLSSIKNPLKRKSEKQSPSSTLSGSSRRRQGETRQAQENAMSNDETCNSHENQANAHLKNYIAFIQNRPSNLFLDEDNLEGQEFYIEIKNKNNKSWTLKKIAKRHLQHIEFIKLNKPSIHHDCFRVLLPVVDMMSRGKNVLT